MVLMDTDKVIPSAAGDIHLKGSAQPTETDFEFTPNNPFTVDVPHDIHGDKIANPGFPVEEEKPGFFETAKAEFKKEATNVHALHEAQLNPPETPNAVSQFYNPNTENSFAFRPAPPGWTPKQEIEKLTNIDSKYLPSLLDARNPQDFQYRLDDVYSQMNDQKALENGSTFAKIIGGLAGLSPVGSIENWIPLTAIATKAKVSAGFLNAAMKNAPGMLAASIVREGAREMDKIDGNIPDFLKDTFIDAAFGTVFFGALGAGKSLLNVMEFNGIKEFAKKYMKGVGYDYVVDAKGDLKGFRAVDTTGGSLSSAEVTKAQELADSAFYKGGLFKIPYVGSASLSLLSGNIPGFKNLFGSPLIQLMTSKYKAASAFANSALDHFITTEGEAKGGTRPPSFELKVKQTRAMLTDLQAQTAAFHAERNGYTITARPAIGLQNALSAMKQKTIETIYKETRSTDYVGKDQFMDEVQRVLYSEESSEHAAVNNAASLYRKVIDDTYKSYRVAHNLPEDWLPPKTAAAYLMRVYDTKYLNENEGQWVSVVSKWLQDSDALIEQHLEPINALKQNIKDFESQFTSTVRSLGSSEEKYLEYGKGVETPRNEFTLKNMKEKLRSMEEQLQDKLREDPNLFIHVDDPNNFSAKEANQLTQLLHPITESKKAVEEQKKVISELKKEKSHKLSTAKSSKSQIKAKPKAEKFVDVENKIKEEETKLRELNDKLYMAQVELDAKARNGELNPRFFNKDENVITFKNPEERLKFRKTHDSDFHREQAAKAYYSSIMNMNPEDTIADVFGNLTGKQSENVLKKRTLPVPDEILYNNNFMTKDLYSKTANYVNYLSKRTHLKTSFGNVTVNGDFEELAESLLDEHKYNRGLINKRIAELEAKGDKKSIEKEKKNLKLLIYFI